MSEMICYGCDRPIPTDGPITASEVIAAIAEAQSKGWKIFWEDPSNYTLLIRGREYVPVNIEISETDWDDDYTRQGKTFEIFSIFTVDGQAFKKEGTADSYGEKSWEGLLKSVRPVEKTVLVYE